MLRLSSKRRTTVITRRHDRRLAPASESTLGADGILRGWAAPNPTRHGPQKATDYETRQAFALIPNENAHLENNAVAAFRLR
jgi:hypothetical protein